jgi:hypothetical protein
MKHRYSGDKSRKFWKRINRFSGEAPHDALYTAGCELQNLEEAVLTMLKLAEVEKDKNKNKKKKK